MFKAEKEEPIVLKVAIVLEKYFTLFNAPEQFPPTRAITRQIKLFDEASLPSKQRQHQLSQEESQEVRVNINFYLQHRWIQPSCS